MRKRTFLLAVGACLTALTLIAPSALADPTGPPPFRDFAGTGSSTTEDVLNELSNAITFFLVKEIGSYNASPPGNITTKDRPIPNPCTIARPPDSFTGVRALRRSLALGDDCLQFARSSLDTAPPADDPMLSKVPFATDGITYVTRSDSNISRGLTIDQLRLIYSCTAPGQANFLPLLPPGETQTSFRKLLAPDFSGFTFGPCVTTVPDENVGTVMTDPREILPYSIPRWIAQVNGAVPDSHGRSVLRSITGVSPIVLNNLNPGSKPVFNVIPDIRVADPSFNAIFGGPNSQICKNVTIITRHGFALRGDCGTIIP